MSYSIVSRRRCRKLPPRRADLWGHRPFPRSHPSGTMWCMSIRAVAFDIHGTLAYPADGRVRAIEVQRLLQGFGLSISFQAYEAARQAVLFLDAARRPLVGWM